MATADLIQELKTDLTNFYNTVSSRGGTAPAQKNTNNLASAAASIPSEGVPETPFDIPYFDGGEWGACAYLKPDGTVGYYTAENENDLKIEGLTALFNNTIKMLPSGNIMTNNLLAYSIGSEQKDLGDNFLGYCYRLQNLYGLENIVKIGDYFLTHCISFNQPIAIPDEVTTIGTGFMADCYLFNNSITLPNSLSSISIFLTNCISFNQPITLPGALTEIGASVLANCFSFNHSLTLPEGVEKIESNFMQGCTSFNQAITLPETLTNLGNYFLSGATSFNQALTVPSALTSVGGYFLYNCDAFVGPLTIETTAKTSGNQSLATQNNQAPMYTQGVTLAGSQAEAWKNALPDRTSSPYRKLILDTSGGLTN